MKPKILNVFTYVLLSISFFNNALALELDEAVIAKYFKDYEGCFVILDLNSQEYSFFNEKLCHQQLSPCSTYKIFNALVGLQTKVVSTETIYKWDHKPKAYKVWEQDHTLKTAIKYSVVWFFQKMAAQISVQRMQSHINAAQYGNRDISSGITNFWLYPNSLKISASEQVAMMSNLYKGTLPFNQTVMNTVKDMLIIDNKHQYQFSGKTGSGHKNGYNVLGWFVGHVTTDNKAFVFATNIQANDNASGEKAKQTSIAILTELGILPAKAK